MLYTMCLIDIDLCLICHLSAIAMPCKAKINQIFWDLNLLFNILHHFSPGGIPRNILGGKRAKLILNSYNFIGPFIRGPDRLRVFVGDVMFRVEDLRLLALGHIRAARVT